MAVPADPLSRSVQLDPITFDGEDWIEYGPPGDRRRIGFHDYTALYAEPGLYECVFRDHLGMHTAERLVDAYEEQLRAAGRLPADERVLDVGAGDGIGGQLLRALGVGDVVAVDIEPMAEVATARDRADGVYRRFLIGDARELATTWDERPFTAVLALASVGADAVQCRDLLDLAATVTERTGHLLFAVSDDLADDVAQLLDASSLRCLSATPYLHRLRPDGSQHGAVAFVAQNR